MKTPLRDLVFRDRGEAFLGVSDWFSITPQRLRRFGDVTAERADEPSAVQDFLLLSLIPAMLGQLIDLPEGATIMNYGLDKVRSRAIAVVEDKVRGRFQLRSRVRLQPEQFLLRFQVALEAEAAATEVLAIDPLIAIVQIEAPGAQA